MTNLGQIRKFAKVEMEHPVFREGTIGEKVAFVGLCLYAWPTPGNGNHRKFKLKQNTLARDIGVHRITLMKSLAGLETNNHISATRKHQRSATEYTIQRKDNGGRYGFIPVEVLQHPKLNATAKLVYLALSAVVNTDSGMAQLSWSSIVKMVGVSRSCIPDAIKQLEETDFAIPFGSTSTGDVYYLKLVNHD